LWGGRRKLREKRGNVGQIGCGPGAPRGDDFAVLKKKGTGHLQAVSGEVADSAALEDRDGTEPPDTRAEEFKEPAASQTEGAVEFAARIRDPGDIAMAAEVAGFPADLEHVDEHEFRAMSACRALEFFQASQDLAGEGAAEVTKKDEDKQPGVGGRSQAFPGGELEYRRGVRQRGIVVQGAGWPAHGPARAAAFMIASEHRANPRRHPQRRKERLPGRGVNRAIFFLEKTADSPDVPTPMTLSTIVFLLLGLVLLVGGAEYLVRGAASLAAAAGVSCARCTASHCVKLLTPALAAE
jgi:Ca2+/Na+ antiporter